MQKKILRGGKETRGPVSLHDTSEDERKEQRAPGTLREIAFRRGFQQGLFEAVKMLAAGRSLEDVLHYCERDVYHWRLRMGKYRGASNSVERPPFDEILTDVLSCLRMGQKINRLRRT